MNKRIVLLGKTGDGKSSCGNLILGEDVFQTESSPTSITQQCSSNTRSINDTEIMVVDSPGYFDTNLSSRKLNCEIFRCIIHCAPGPHAFVIVLKMGRYTSQEIETVEEITKSFGEKALKYAVVLFTFGDQLCEGQNIEEFVNQSKELQDLVNKCGGRVHVVDNKYWNKQQDGYRSNRVQVKKLLNTIEEMVKENGGECYISEMLRAVYESIGAFYKVLCEGRMDVPDINMREQAKQNVHITLSSEMFLGAVFAAGAGIAAVFILMKKI